MRCRVENNPTISSNMSAISLFPFVWTFPRTILSPKKSHSRSQSHVCLSMSSDKKEVLYDFSPMIKVFKDGTVDRTAGLDRVPAAVDPETGVRCKDVVISQNPAVSARIFLPRTAKPGRKLPVYVYYHGGVFFVGSAFCASYHPHVSAVVAEANVVAVSVEYRLAPEHPIPAAYEDSWEALKWVASHSTGAGSEEWLNDHADLSRLFIGGDSAGANLAHNTALRAGIEKDTLSGVNIDGMFLNCPFFWGKDPIGVEIGNPFKAVIDSMWTCVHPTSIHGMDDPFLNVVKEPRLPELDCRRALVYVGEKDILKDRGYQYRDELQKNGWDGEIEVVEVEDAIHDFNLYDPNGDKTVSMIKKLASFMNV